MLALNVNVSTTWPSNYTAGFVYSANFRREMMMVTSAIRSCLASIIVFFTFMTAALANDNLDVPVTVAHGNAIWPITASFDGYAAVPPQLLVLSVPFAKGTLPAQGAVTVFDAIDKPLATQQRAPAHCLGGSVRCRRLCFQYNHNNRPRHDAPSAVM